MKERRSNDDEASTGLPSLEEPTLTDGLASLMPDIARGEKGICTGWLAGGGGNEEKKKVKRVKFTFNRLPMANEGLRLTGENMLSSSCACLSCPPG